MTNRVVLTDATKPRVVLADVPKPRVATADIANALGAADVTGAPRRAVPRSPGMPSAPKSLTACAPPAGGPGCRAPNRAR